MSVGRLRIDIVIRLDPPATTAPNEHFHQLRSHNSIRWQGDPAGHRLDTANLVVDIDDGNLRRDEADAANRMVLRRAFVERRKNLAVALSEGGLAVHHHSEQIGE